jgi:hypothetical protein
MLHQGRAHSRLKSETDVALEVFVSNQWRRVAAGLLLFGISFGYVEAAVVVYLRTIYDPIRRQIDPARPPSDLFPLMTADQIRAAAPGIARLFGVEVVREAATIVMLAAVALVIAGGLKFWLPAFAVAFGAWDLFFYVFLKVLIDWPASVFTWDILFLIPVPWAAPVLAPSIVSLTIIAAGIAALRRPVRMRAVHWILVFAGCGLILFSFMQDFPNTTAGGLPNPFDWPVFGLGELVGAAAFLHALRTSTLGES